ncbi:amino acid ABC transporter substrate-binding protein [Haloplanus rallus]|uniref:Amino acid ABC transporter substrate-binding protein n=1 Tax=Haloplanus rallus TaxID=1816183 RepID=A0A6B9FEW2_9EURY|nr:ABC transporter substrate-binding protein [Haloplanus rallus]QGX95490.1 amino acid ABC transporter substrate-binding protein [Haloplanus rallus]
MTDRTVRRRRFVKAAGAASIVGLAGCSGGGGGDGGDGGGGDGGDGGGGDGGDGGGGDGGGDSILVGTLAPFSQGLGWVGPNAARGRDVALADINDAGVLGSEIEINEQDTETTPQAAVSGFNTLDEAGVVATLGPSSTVIPNLFQPVADAQLPMLSVSAGTTQLDDVGGPDDYLWRTVPSDAIAGRAQGQYALDNDYTQMAVVYKDDKGSQSFSAAVADYFTGQGGEQVADVALAINSDSYRSEMQEIADSGADVISMTAGTEVSALFMRNYIEADLDIPIFIGNDVITADFIERIGPDVMAEAPIFGQAPAPGPAYDQFQQAHQDMHGQAPGTFGAAGYDAMNLIALAAQRAGEATRQAITDNINPVARPEGTEVTTFSEGKEELEAGNEINYQGASNPQNFDEDGDPVGPFSVLEVEGGEWTELTTFSTEELTA